MEDEGSALHFLNEVVKEGGLASTLHFFIEKVKIQKIILHSFIEKVYVPLSPLCRSASRVSDSEPQGGAVRNATRPVAAANEPNAYYPGLPRFLESKSAKSASLAKIFGRFVVALKRPLLRCK